MRNLSGMMKKVQEMQGRMQEITRDLNLVGSRVQLAVGRWLPAYLEKVRLSSWKFHQS